MVPEIGTEPSKSLVSTPVFTPFFPSFFPIPDRIPDKIQGVPPFNSHGEGQKPPADTSDTAETHLKLILKKKGYRQSLIQGALYGLLIRLVLDNNNIT